MSILALMWIQATFKANQQRKERAAANIIDGANTKVRSITGSTNSASGTAWQQESLQHHGGGLPKSVALVFLVHPYLDFTRRCLEACCSTSSSCACEPDAAHNCTAICSVLAVSNYQTRPIMHTTECIESPLTMVCLRQAFPCCSGKPGAPRGGC